MPRRGEIQAREAIPDSVYSSVLVTQVIHKIMLDGKKSIAEQIVYSALEDRKSTRLNSSHIQKSRMPSSA